jgi:XisI protein
MDTLTHYRLLIRQVLAEYAAYEPADSTARSEVIIDADKDHYEVQDIGRLGNRRIHGSLIHLDIINGKVWIQHDGTDRPVAYALIEAGIPKEDIVLAFHPEHLRQHTGFAIS